jgi:hypothetical protein
MGERERGFPHSHIDGEREREFFFPFSYRWGERERSFFSHSHIDGEREREKFFSPILISINATSHHPKLKLHNLVGVLVYGQLYR